MTSQPYDDPFATSERHPSLSFKDAPIGTSYTGIVKERPAMVQARDFETGERAVWDDGNPKMTVVTSLDINGETYSLWAPKPSAMFAAIGEAQQQAGSAIAVGGKLTVTYTGDKPNEKNPRLNPQKQYSVAYEPPSAFDAPPGATSAPSQQPPPAPAGGGMTGWHGRPQQGSTMPAAEPPF